MTDKNEVIIPRSIEYESKEFIVTTIHENAFKNTNKIESIEFPQDSKLSIIEEYAFMNSSLKKISIPASVVQLTEGWCGRLSKLQINLDIKNPNYLNFENKFILGKIDSKSDIFDVLVYSLQDVETIKIPSFIKRIAPFAFYASSSLQVVDIDENSELQSIGKFAFANSSIESIFIPKNVSQIEKSAFGECNLKYIDFDDDSKLREISQELFFDSTLISITIPNHVTRICESAFFFCGKLKSVKINQESELRVIEKSAFYGTEIENISLPSCVELKDGWNNNMSRIKDIKIFQKEKENIKNYKEFVLGKSDIYKDLFDVILFVKPNVEKVIIPSFVRCISSHTFSNCIKLDNIEFENGSNLEIIGKCCFNKSNVETLVIPPHVTKIEENCFSFSNKLKAIEFSDNSEIKSIGNFVFSYSNIDYLSIPSSIINLNNSLFQTPNLNRIKIIPCKDKNIMILDDQLIIGKSNIKCDVFDVLLFANRNIRNAIIPFYIKKIGPNAFNECNQLESVTFSDDSHLISIENDAFSKTSIKKIIIPKSVVNIGECAFMNCSNLKNVEFSNNSKLTKMNKNSFACTSIEHILIPDHLTKIEKYAFSSCYNFKRIEFSKNSNLRSIEKEAFSDSSIKYILIPRHVSRIAKNAFYSCKLKTIEFGNCPEIKFIDKSAFSRSDIECIKIPSSVVYIGKSAFKNCNNFKIIEIDENMELNVHIIESFYSTSKSVL